MGKIFEIRPIHPSSMSQFRYAKGMEKQNSQVRIEKTLLEGISDKTTIFMI